MQVLPLYCLSEKEKLFSAFYMPCVNRKYGLLFIEKPLLSKKESEVAILRASFWNTVQYKSISSLLILKPSFLKGRKEERIKWLGR